MSSKDKYNLFSCVVFVTWATAMYLEFPRYYYMIDALQNGKPYTINVTYDPKEVSIQSRSPVLWLIVHLTVTFVLMFASGLKCICYEPGLQYNKRFSRYFDLLHWFWIIILLLNAKNFADLTTTQSSIIVCIMGTLLSVLHLLDNVRKIHKIKLIPKTAILNAKYLYFITFCSSVYFKAILYFRTWYGVIFVASILVWMITFNMKNNRKKDK